MFESAQVFEIADRAALFRRWEDEVARFRQIYRNLSASDRTRVVSSSPCGHTYGQHVPCMIIWIEAAIRFFEPRLSGQKIPYSLDGFTMQGFTNQGIASVSDLNWEELWRRLDESESKLRTIIEQLPDHEIFTDQDRTWEHLVWSGFGHYGEHSDEWEWEQAEQPGFSPDHRFTSPLLRKSGSMKKRSP